MKLTVIGLDSFPLNLFKGHLLRHQNFGRLAKEGTWGRLLSTVPPMTPTAWSTFATGLDPGKHKVMGFFTRERASPQDVGRIVSGSAVRGNSIWRALSEAGKTVGVFGVPLTYKPEPVDGFMISGFPLPRGARDYTYPNTLARELEAHGWNFADVPGQSRGPHDLERFFLELKERTMVKTDAVIHLIERYDPDFFMVHYFETDKLFHEFLNFMDPSTSSKSGYGSFHGFIDDYFELLDAQLGRILEHSGRGRNVLIVSDHGAAPGRFLFFADTWLLRRGYLKVKTRFGPTARKAIFDIGVTPALAYRLAPQGILRRVTKGGKNLGNSSGDPKGKQTPLAKVINSVFLTKVRDVDWEKSVCYSYQSLVTANFYLTPGMSQSSAREARSRLASDLVSLRHEGQRIFDVVKTDAELYKWEGDRPDLPDVVAYNDRTVFRAIDNRHIFTSRDVITRTYEKGYPAHHDRNGVFLAWGPQFGGGGEAAALGIEDMHPTILHLFDLAISRDVDGRVAHELFDADSDAFRRTPRFAEAVPNAASSVTFSQEEEESVLKKLKDMGYA